MTTTLEVTILYGSQTGNSQQAAEDLSEVLPSQLSTPNTTITSRPISLDDFLEIELNSKSIPMMPPLFVIITSSYGVGHAPLGCLKFRQLCDHILSTSNDSQSQSPPQLLLSGCHYALLGLGDSKYSTFFQNPTAIDDALRKAGAVRVGPLGKADASAGIKEDEPTQIMVVERWCKDIVNDLAIVVKGREGRMMKGGGVEEEEKKLFTEMRDRTMGICRDILEDWEDYGSGSNDGGAYMSSSLSWNQALFVLIPVLVAIFAAYFY